MELLTKTNQDLLASRKKKPSAPKPIEPSKDAEKYYSMHLRSMVRNMAKLTYAAIEPELKRLKPEYTADARMTMDSWVDDILSAIRRVSDLFKGTIFNAQATRVAAGTVSRAEADNAEAFRDSVNKAVGIDLGRITRSEDMNNYLQASLQANVNLIKSIPDQYFRNIETMVLDGMRGGLAPTAIAKQIQEETGVTYRRAKLIARDQVAQLNSDLTRKRQEEAGIEYYKSVDSNDQRVSGNPSGKYPNAKISCWGIARQDIGYGPGVYRVDTGATWKGETNLHPGKHHPLCRCTAQALIEGVNYFPTKKK